MRGCEAKGREIGDVYKRKDGRGKERKASQERRKGLEGGEDDVREEEGGEGR